MKKEALVLTLILLIFPMLNAITGEAITGQASEAPTNVSVFVEQGAPIIHIYSPENKTYYESNLLLNYSIRNDFNSSWYNIDDVSNVSLGNLSDNSLTINLPLGSHKVSLFANNSYGLSSKTILFTISEQPSSSSSSSSSSSGGSSSSSGGGSALPSSPTFSISPDIIELTLFQGETITKSLSIENTQNQRVSLSAIPSKLEDFSIIRRDITLEAKESTNLDFVFSVPSEYLPGVYFGEIKISSKIVKVIINVKQKNSLFDMTLLIPEESKKIYSRSKVLFTIDMTNLASSKEQIPFDISLLLMDLNENVVYGPVTESLVVNDSVTFDGQLMLPKEIEDGSYVLLSEVKYQGISLKSYDTFELRENNLIIVPIVFAVIAITSGVFLILIKKGKIKFNTVKNHNIKKHETVEELLRRA